MADLIFNNKTTVSEVGGGLVYDNGYMMPQGKYLNVSHFYNSTRTGFGAYSSWRFWYITFTKLYDSNVSNLQMYCLMPGHEHSSDVCGIYAHINGSTTREIDGSAFYDIWYIGANAPNETFSISTIAKEFSNLDAGTHTLEFGWQTRNLATGNKPFVIWNLNSTDDARQHQMRSHCTIYEVKR